MVWIAKINQWKERKRKRMSRMIKAHARQKGEDAALRAGCFFPPVASSPVQRV